MRCSAAGSMRLRRRGTDGLSTHRWRKADSNRRSPPANELVSSAGHACAPGAKDGLLAVVYLAGTKGSNPVPSSSESSELRSCCVAPTWSPKLTENEKAIQCEAAHTSLPTEGANEQAGAALLFQSQGDRIHSSHPRFACC